MVPSIRYSIFSFLVVATFSICHDLAAEPNACKTCICNKKEKLPTCSAEKQSAFVFIPEGSFDMGDFFAERNPDERPVHSIYLRSYWIQQTEVTFAEWVRVRKWAIKNGYDFDFDGAGKADDHPVHSINWYDVVKWCNARSEMEQRLPAFYSDSTLQIVYRRGRFDLAAEQVNWHSDGYRLPTEAEWEKAARGGKLRNRFPWGNEIGHQAANYKSSAEFAYDVSDTRGRHPKYHFGERPFTSPVGSFPPNAYGLFDTSGNVWEWCWDWYDPHQYQTLESTQPNTRGSPKPGEYRVIRGGGWSSEPRNLRCAVRDHGKMAIGVQDRGLRLVRSASNHENQLE